MVYYKAGVGFVKPEWEQIKNLVEQTHALQTTNTKLTLRVRELCEIDIESDREFMEAELAVEETGTDIPIRNLFQKYINKIRELEQDGKRLDLIAKNLLIIYPPVPSEDEFDGLWVVCAYELPNIIDYLSKDKDLRQAIDKAVPKEKKE